MVPSSLVTSVSSQWLGKVGERAEPRRTWPSELRKGKLAAVVEALGSLEVLSRQRSSGKLFSPGKSSGWMDHLEERLGVNRSLV